MVALVPVLMNAQTGSDLFTQNCGACHSVGKGKLVGPDLKGVQDRHTDAWLVKWITSSQSLVNAKDKDAMKLFQENNQIVMPDQALNSSQIQSILGYIKTGGEPIAVSASADNAAATPVADPPKTAKASADVTQQQAEAYNPQKDTIFGILSPEEYLFVGILSIMLLIVYVLGSALRAMSSAQK